MRRADSFEKTLMLGKIVGRRRRGRQRMDGWMALPTQRTWVWVDSGSWWWTGRPGVLWFMGSQRVEHDWATELNWTEYLVQVSESNIKYLENVWHIVRTLSSISSQDANIFWFHGFSHWVMSDYLWPHEPQHARSPCPSPTPGVYPNSCLLSRWCHPTISPSV